MQHVCTMKWKERYWLQLQISCCWSFGWSPYEVRQGLRVHDVASAQDKAFRTLSPTKEICLIEWLMCWRGLAVVFRCPPCLKPHVALHYDTWGYASGIASPRQFLWDSCEIYMTSIQFDPLSDGPFDYWRTIRVSCNIKTTNYTSMQEIAVHLLSTSCVCHFFPTKR